MRANTLPWVALALGLVAAGCTRDATIPTGAAAVVFDRQRAPDTGDARDDEDARNEDHDEREKDGLPFTYAVIGDFPYGPVKRAELPTWST